MKMNISFDFSIEKYNIHKEIDELVSIVVKGSLEAKYIDTQ